MFGVCSLGVRFLGGGTGVQGLARVEGLVFRVEGSVCRGFGVDTSGFKCQFSKFKV